MKKLLALLLAGVMLLSVIGCAAAETDSGKTKIRVMLWGSLEGKNAEWDNILALNPEMAEKYEIELVGGANEKENLENVRLALAGNESICDLLAVNYQSVPELARAGVLRDLSDVIAPYESKLTAAAKALSQYDGQTIAVPSQMKCKIWFYRKDIFDECGIDATKVKTTDDFIAAGKKIQEKYPNAYLMNLGRTATSSMIYYVLSGNGASFFDENGNYNLSTNEGVIKCLEDYKKLVESGISLEVDDWTPDWQNAFATDQLISCLSATWMATPFLPTYAGEDDSGKWAATIWPEIGGASGGSDYGGSVYVVPSFSSCPDDAAKFIAWYHLDEVAETAFLDYYDSMAFIANADLLNSDLVKSRVNPYFGESFTQAQIDAADIFNVFNFSPNAATESSIVVEYFNKAIFGEMSIEDALKAAEEDLKNQIGNAFD